MTTLCEAVLDDTGQLEGNEYITLSDIHNPQDEAPRTSSDLQQFE